VRLEALLPLHPAWEDVRQIDALLAHTRRLPSPSAQASLPLDEVALPSPLKTDGSIPMNLAKARAERTVPAALERVERLRTALDVLNSRVVRREQTAGQKVVAADVARQEADLRAGLEAEERRIRAQVPETLRDLQFREIALQSQVDGLPEPHRSEAQRKLDRVRQEIEAIQAAREAGDEAARQRVARQVEDYRQERRARETERLDQLRARLNRETDQIVAENQEEARRSLGRLKALAMPSVPRSADVRAKRLPSPAEVAAGVAPTTAERSAAATSDEIAALTSRRQRLLHFITGDVRRRVENLAAQKQWRIAFAPASGLPDMTAQVVAALREEWKP